MSKFDQVINVILEGIQLDAPLEILTKGTFEEKLDVLNKNRFFIISACRTNGHPDENGNLPTTVEGVVRTNAVKTNELRGRIAGTRYIETTGQFQEAISNQPMEEDSFLILVDESEDEMKWSRLADEYKQDSILVGDIGHYYLREGVATKNKVEYLGNKIIETTTNPFWTKFKEGDTTRMFVAEKV